MKKMYDNYLNDLISLNKYQKLGIIFLIIVICGIFGWIYEFIFYYFNGGMKDFYMQGGNFLPWINIYATGALMVFLLTKKYKKNPLIVFIITCTSTGILEYISGYLIYTLFDGLRLWDYNNEILNFGNVGGFICLRSILFFGISGLILVYFIVPLCTFLSTKINYKIFFYISLVIFSVFMIDEFYNLAIARLFNLPRASDIYTSIGFKYVEFVSKK